MEVFATALPALDAAFAMILQPHVLGFLVLGVVMGLCIGVFPGLGGIAGLSLLLPFMFGMEPVTGLALMIGMVAVVPTSDTFASVLMGIPGSSASQATVLDGFPMAKKGQAARALSAAFASSLFGGLVGAAFLTVFILAARPIVLLFQTPELLMITIFGLSMVGIVVVEDTGPGIPDEALTKVFKRFYSERPEGQFGNNSGLGLAISKQIVEAHGGVIWAENIRPTEMDITSEPLGARFVVGLPV